MRVTGKKEGLAMKSRHLKGFIAAGVMIVSINANAMLVAYEDSLGIMGVNQSFHNELFLNYSLTPHFAVGERNIRFVTTDGVKQFFVPEADFLIYRWNNPDSQANFYAGGGYGAESFMSQTQGVAMANVAADWESRKYYLDAEFQSLIANDTREYNSAKFRAGFAPYLADFNELSTWFILQFETMPFVENNLFLTPMIRLFYKNVLVEIGADFQGNFMFNYMIHI